MRTITICLLLFVTLYGKTLSIAAAANVSFALKEIQKVYQTKYPNQTIRITISSSGKLANQILHGAKFDLFLSADTYFPTILYKHHKAVKKPKVYAKGVMVLFSRKGYELSHPFTLLKQKNITKIVIANPKTAPYGKAAMEILKNTKLYTQIQQKLIYAESVGQTFLYALKIADVGFIAKSLVLSKKNQYSSKKYYVEIDSSLYSPINQAVVALNTKSETLLFYEFLFSPVAKQIFKQYGYKVE